MKNLLIVILLFSSIPIFASGVQPSGTGISDDPYQVASLNNLLWICSNNTSWDKFFIQIENIDASDTQNWNAGAGFYPIGNDGTKFSGNYNGAGYSVDGLYINRVDDDYVGLFGYTDGCTIQNIGVTNMNITGRYYVGGLAGYNYNYSDINNSYSTGTVSGTNKTGGLIGVNDNSDISKSFSTGTVNGSTRTGGLVGDNLNASNIENSYSTGGVSGSINIGGLVGVNESGSNVSNSYSTGSVNGTNNVGGLAGYNYNSYVSNSFWDTDTSGQATSCAGTGKTTAEMQTMATFSDAGWDFMDETTNGGNDYWGINFAANNAYPFLEWQGFTNTGSPYSAGTGTELDPYQIANLNDLEELSLRTTDWATGIYFIQTADIDAADTQNWNAGAGFSPIGNEDIIKFSGNYNGAGYTIDGLYINRSSTDYVGFFGLTLGSSIQNVGVTNVNIFGRYYVGGLIGYNFTNSYVSDSYSTGNVNGESQVGGLVGKNYYATVSNSYSKGNVSATNRDVGGLVGGNYTMSHISNSYSTGSVIGSGYFVGGLVGYNSSSEVNNSFWDTDTSGQATSAAGTGKTTFEMQTLVIFTDAGWDFMGETVNGNDDYWGINNSDNSGYPFLEWQGFEHTGSLYSGGTGTELDPYQIANLDDLEKLSLRTIDWAIGNYFIQTADIDAADTQNWNSGAGFSPIGNEDIIFNGNYNGTGYTIDGLYINLPSTNDVGLFSYTVGCTIQNVGVTNVNIFGQFNVGGLVGENKYSNISNSYSTGSVNGESQVGGLVGDNTYSNISNSYSTGSVIGSGYFVGGLVGYNNRSNISNSYSTGSVNGTNNVGGLAGYNYISPISNSFWDTQTSGQATSAGGTGKTTAEMKTLATFTDAGWDFMGETVNGIDDIWGINGAYNSGYPFLVPTDCLPVIISVSDVPGDQGRHIIATWSKSSFDDYNQNTPISSYNLWIEYPFEARGYNVTSDINEYLQFVSNHRNNSTDNTNPQEILKPFEMVDHSHNTILKASVPEILFERDGELWISVGVTNAMQWDSYSMAAMTFRDSSSAEDNYSRFFVSAHTAIPSLYFSSTPMDGYSLDNIAPNVADNIAVAISNSTRNNTLTISWDQVYEGSYQGNSYPEQNGIWYHIYASNHPDFICDETTYLNTTQDTSLEIDVSSEERMFFKIIVSDQE